MRALASSGARLAAVSSELHRAVSDRSQAIIARRAPERIGSFLLSVPEEKPGTACPSRRNSRGPPEPNTKRSAFMKVWRREEPGSNILHVRQQIAAKSRVLDSSGVRVASSMRAPKHRGHPLRKRKGIDRAQR